MEMLNIYTRNLELTERLRTYVERKVARFERYLPNLDTIRIDLSESNARDINFTHCCNLHLFCIYFRL